MLAFRTRLYVIRNIRVYIFPVINFGDGIVCFFNTQMAFIVMEHFHYYGFCMHLKDVTLKIVHETRMSLTNDSLPDILMEIIHVFEMEVYMKLFT
jgi:hypothetical protein